MPYGFSIVADENVVSVMKKIETAMNSMAAKVDAATKSAQASMEHLESAAGKVGERLAELFALERLKHYGMELLHLTAEFEGYQNIIRYASKNSYDAGQNLEYIGSAVSRLHLPLKEATESFSEMQAGFYGTGIEGEHLRKVFEGISTASSVLHLTPYQFGNVTFALKEIGELGTLQARQMRMLAFALPGSMHIAAQAMKMNSAEFHEAMHQQAIKSSVFLPAFAEALQQHYAPGLGNAGNSLISQMNDTKNAFLKVALEMGENLRPVFTNIMHSLQGAFDSGIIKIFVENIKPIAEVLLDLAKIWITYKAGVIAADLAMKGYAVGLKLVEAVQMTVMFGTEGLDVALQGMKATMLTTGVGAFAVLIGYLASQFMDLNKQVDDALEKFSHLKALQGDADGFGAQFGRATAFFNNKGAHTSEEQAENFSEMQALQGRIAKHMGGVNDQIIQAETDLQEGKKRFVNPNSEYAKRQDAPAVEAIQQLKKLAAQDQDKILTLGSFLNQLKRAGVGPASTAIHSDNSTAVKDGSLQTMGLAGAKGGLGEAKTVVIHIGTLQRNEVGTPDGLKLAGENAIEVMLRALNNIAYGQSKTM